MNGSLATERAGEAGFTLIETLVAVALMALVLSGLANITSQWLPNWSHGMDRIQRSEQVSLGLQRVAADLAAAEYVPANREQHRLLFDGSESSVTLVRTALGPNAGSRLDVVRIGETNDRRDLVTVRSREPFEPLSATASISEQGRLGDPVVLLRAPFKLSFSYAGRDRVWKSNWHGSDSLPVAIMLTVREVATERVLPVSTVVSLHVEAPATEDAEQNSKDASNVNSGFAGAAPGQGSSR